MISFFACFSTFCCCFESSFWSLLKFATLLKSLILKTFRVNKFLAKLNAYSKVGTAKQANTIPPFVEINCFFRFLSRFDFLISSRLFGKLFEISCFKFFGWIFLNNLLRYKCSPSNGAAK